MPNDFFVHPTAELSPRARVGSGTRIWHHCQVREDAVIGRECILSKGVYVDTGVQIGDRVKVQNGVSVYHGVTLEDGVFCGPHCVFTNDLRPRAVNPDGTPKAADDWTLTHTVVRAGASIGAHATIVCGVTIGRWAMIGAGAVVTHDVPDHGLVVGVPARLRGFVCPCGHTLEPPAPWLAGDPVTLHCPACGREADVPSATYRQMIDNEMR